MKEQKVQIPIARKSNIFREKIPLSAHHLDHRNLNQKSNTQAFWNGYCLNRKFQHSTSFEKIQFFKALELF